MSGWPTSTRQWRVAQRPTHLPQLTGPDATFEMATVPLSSTLQPEQLLLKTLFLSNDPAVRGWIYKDLEPERLYATALNQGDLVRARTVSEVLESTSAAFKPGDLVVSMTGWTDFFIVSSKDVQLAKPLPRGLSPSHHLGFFGVSGLTAWQGLVVVAQAKPSDVVVISSAAGAIGSIAVQFAKRYIGCKYVVGIAGSAEKCEWVVSKLGADACLNYNDPNFVADLKQATQGPERAVDVYFDNVGGSTLDLLLTRMARHGRVAVCGLISMYNQPKTEAYGVKSWFDVVSMRIKLEGFVVYDVWNRRSEAADLLIKAVEDGTLVVDEQQETVRVASFEEIPKVWLEIFGRSVSGKLVTKFVG